MCLGCPMRGEHKAEVHGREFSCSAFEISTPCFLSAAPVLCGRGMGSCRG